MTTTLTRVLSTSFADAEARVTAALKAEGFGVLTRIDLQATLKEKLGAELAPHVILGACNPPFALRALTATPEAALMLPCNVTLNSEGAGVRVRAVDPLQQVKAFSSRELDAMAGEVRARLERALAAL